MDVKIYIFSPGQTVGGVAGTVVGGVAGASAGNAAANGISNLISGGSYLSRQSSLFYQPRWKGRKGG